MFWGAVYRAGIKFRNSEINNKLKFLLDSQGWSLSRLRKYQEDKMRALLTHAYENCEFYKNHFDAAGFSLEEFSGLKDILKVPTLTKADLLSNAGDIQLRNVGKKQFYSETSGSSGEPLVFYRDANWDAWHRASVFRGYRWYDVDPWDRNGYLWGFNFARWKRMKVRFLDLLQNRFRMFSYDDKDVEWFARKLERAEFVSGYSSMIYEVAKAIENMERPPKLSLKFVKGTSEKIYDKYQGVSERVFGRKIVSEYGAAEAGILAFECPQGVMHMNMETSILEEVDGEAVVTNLVSNSFPIIRYRIGDYIEIATDIECECGMKHDAVVDVLGRVGKVIRGKSSSYPSLTLYYVFKNLAMGSGVVLNYQAVQDVPGRIVLRIDGELSREELGLLAGELGNYYGDDLDVEIVDKEDLKSAGKKKTDFVTSLD